MEHRLTLLRLQIEYWLTEAKFYALKLDNEGYASLYQDAIRRSWDLLQEFEQHKPTPPTEQE